MVSTSIPEIDFQFQISPNPSKDYTMLSWTLPASDKVSADLFDPEGRLVQTLFHDLEMISGNHQKRIVWSPAIPAGVYYLRFSVDKESQMIKLIKQ